MYVEALHSLTQAMAALSISCLLPPWPDKAFRKLSRNSFWQSQRTESEVSEGASECVFFECVCLSYPSPTLLALLSSTVSLEMVCVISGQRMRRIICRGQTAAFLLALSAKLSTRSNSFSAASEHTIETKVGKMVRGNTDKSILYHTQKMVFTKQFLALGQCFFLFVFFKSTYFFQHQYQVSVPIRGLSIPKICVDTTTKIPIMYVRMNVHMNVYDNFVLQ